MTVRRVFDAHFHIGPYGQQVAFGRNIRPIPPSLDEPEACSKYLDCHDLAGGLIVPTYLDDQAAAFRYNDLVIKTVESDSRLLGGLWVSPLEDFANECDAVLGRLPHPRIRALKIASNTWSPFSVDPSTWNRPVRRQMERILEHACTHKLTIHFHTGYLAGARPLEFAAFMRAYGHAATYQLVHMGEAIAPAFAFVPRFVDWIKDGLQVFTDTSIVPAFGPPWLLESLDKHNLGCDRVLFATDTPWGRYPAERAKIESMDVNSAVLDAVFWGNAAKLYRLSQPIATYIAHATDSMQIDA